MHLQVPLTAVDPSELFTTLQFLLQVAVVAFQTKVGAHKQDVRLKMSSEFATVEQFTTQIRDSGSQV
jgi:hypothetical protein